MRVPAWVLVTAAVIAALPFGWGLGVLVAYAVTAGRIGQLPALTVPLAIIGSIGFAASPWLAPSTRLTVLLVGTAMFLLLASVLS
jgi:hypothetical protein